MNKNTIITAALVGLITSIIFILIQPLFAMSTLTSRHAAAYINLGGYSATAALFLSWFVHISVSIAYALLAAVIYKINNSLAVNIGQIIVLGWVTTLIATPANEFVVKLVTTEQWPALSALSPLNMEIGPKLWLHMVFFILVILGLMVSNRNNGNQANNNLVTE